MQYHLKTNPSHRPQKYKMEDQEGNGATGPGGQYQHESNSPMDYSMGGGSASSVLEAAAAGNLYHHQNSEMYADDNSSSGGGASGMYGEDASGDALYMDDDIEDEDACSDQGYHNNNQATATASM